MAPKRRKLGGAESEEEKVEGLSFKWKLNKSRNFEKCSFGVKGTIVLNGNDVGEVEASLVDRTFIREGLEARPNTFPDFQDVCKEIDTEAGDELCDAGADLFDYTSGKVTYRPMLSNANAWDPFANSGGLLHIFNVRVAKEHRGKALGLRAMRHLLHTRLRGRWTLAIMKPSGEPLGEGHSRHDACEAWHHEHFLASQGDEAGLEAAIRKREGSASAAAEGVARYFARLGFSQAGPANDGANWWFLVKGTAKERTKAEAKALHVAVQAPRPEFTAAESKLRKLVGWRVENAELEAFVMRRELDGERLPEEDGPVDLAKAAPLHAVVAEAGRIGRLLKDRIPALVSLGCGVNQRDHLGYTPLSLAAGLLCRLKDQPRAIAALLDAGADPSIPCPEGVLPYEEAEKKWPSYYNYLRGIEDRHCCTNKPTRMDSAFRSIQQQAMSFTAVIRMRLMASAGPPPASLRKWYLSTIDSIAAQEVAGHPSMGEMVQKLASDAKKEPFNDRFFDLWQRMAIQSPGLLKDQASKCMEGMRQRYLAEARKHGLVTAAIPEGLVEEARAAFEQCEALQSDRAENFKELAEFAQNVYGAWVDWDSFLDPVENEHWDRVHK